MKNPFKCDSVRVTSPYGTRTLNGVTESHGGYDMVGVGSTDVVAVEGGVVASSQIVTNQNNRTWEWGNYVCIKTDSGQYHYYCHLASRAVKKGQRVKDGDKLGVMGNTGYSFGAHLHFEVRKSDGKTKLSPEGVLGIPNKVGTYIAKQKTQFERDLDFLVTKGVITTPEHWRELGKKDKYFPVFVRNVIEKLG